MGQRQQGRGNSTLRRCVASNALTHARLAHVRHISPPKCRLFQASAAEEGVINEPDSVLLPGGHRLPLIGYGLLKLTFLQLQAAMRVRNGRMGQISALLTFHAMLLGPCRHMEHAGSSINTCSARGWVPPL